MAWLWLISVGVTDVQFPVWRKDAYGQWTGLQRFEIGRSGIRAVHDGLLDLLRSGKINFPNGLPRTIARHIARDLRLEFIQEGGDFLATIKHAKHEEYRISELTDTLPNVREAQLPLYCPKVEELLDIARDIFAGQSLTIVVLNTCRAHDFGEASDEPIASGPLVAKCLAERMGLQWIDGQGHVPDTLTAGSSTWVDVLVDQEAMEDQDAQRQVVKRLTATIQAWSKAVDAHRQIAITISGGMPPLKPLFERVPAICVGQQHVRLLDKPERASASAAVFNYDARVAERETLRFHCVEALRKCDYIGAYGLAHRFLAQPWAVQVRDRLGPLLELPGGSLQLNGHDLDQVSLGACRIEVSLCMGDIAGALKRLSLFIESAIWALIATDARIIDRGLGMRREDGSLIGNLPVDDELFCQNLLERDANGSNCHRVLGLTWRWPHWLKQRVGQQTGPAAAVDRLRLAYHNGPAVCESNPRKYRNLLAHGAVMPINLNDVERCLLEADLIAEIAQPFGRNFLAVAEVKATLDGLGAKGLTESIQSYLQELLTQVIEG